MASQPRAEGTHRQEILGRAVDDVAGGETEAEPAVGTRPVCDGRIAAVELLAPKGLQAVQEDDVARSKHLVIEPAAQPPRDAQGRSPIAVEVRGTAQPYWTRRRRGRGAPRGRRGKGTPSPGASVGAAEP